MAFDFSRAAILPTDGFGSMMGGFVGPAQILQNAPFQKALQTEQALRAGIFESGMGELGANSRNQVTVDAQLKIAQDNLKANEKANRLAGISSLMAVGNAFGGGTGGRKAGQVFGVGNELSATQRAAQEVADQNSLMVQLLKQQQLAAGWSAGSRGMAAELAKYAPPIPRG